MPARGDSATTAGSATRATTAGAAATAGAAIAAAGAATTAAGAATTSAGTGADWVTYGHDAGRSGTDLSSPPAGQVALAWSSGPLDGAVYAQPLVVGAEVIVATENDTVYALDRTSGAVRWSRHLATPVAGASLPCGDIDPSGITGTPVADPGTGTLWVVTFAIPAHHTLWGVDLATGAVRSARVADPPGADPRAQQERSALALLGSEVFIAYGGLYGDCSDYHGWVVGLPQSGAGRVISFVTPTQREAGIWAPPGPVVAGDTLLVATGNGTPADAVDDANSVIRLSSALAVTDTFTPANFAALSAKDEDLGSTSPVLVPGGLVFMIGKDGVGYVLAVAHLGGVGGQLASSQVCGGAFGGDAVDGDVVVVPCGDGLHALRVTPATGSAPPSVTPVWAATGSRSGPVTIAGGLAWTVDRDGSLAGYRLTTGARQFSAKVTVVSSFPALAAADGELFVPSGDRILAFGPI